jgi:phage terminase large subunit-like protein
MKGGGSPNIIIRAERGSTITAIASDYAGAAGAHPVISVFDELWGYTSERSRRLWDEMIPTFDDAGHNCSIKI